jgi:hypothetical protein
MADIAPLIAVWAVLCLVLVGYVVYRFMTDKANGSPQHPMYPLISRPTDHRLPAAHAWLEWAAYVCLLLGLAGLLVVLASDSNLMHRPQHVVEIAGPAAALGILLLVIARVRARR